MPCYSVNLLSVKIEAADRDLLEKALKRLKLTFTRQKDNFYITYGNANISIEADRARLPTQLQNNLNEIKQAYSMEVIETAAETFSWTVSEEEDHIILRRYASE